MRSIPIALAGLLLATTAFAPTVFAQDAPPPSAAAGPGAAPPPGGPLAAAEFPPPPPPPVGPRGDRPPPPGAAVMIDRGVNGTVHVDVHCARTDNTKDCADIASRLFAATSTAPSGK